MSSLSVSLFSQNNSIHPPRNPSGPPRWDNLPAELITHTLSFLPDPKTGGRVAATSRYFRTVIDEKREIENSKIKSHPFFSFLMENSSWIGGKKTYREKIPLLDRYVKCANIIGVIRRDSAHQNDRFKDRVTRILDSCNQAMDRYVRDPKETVRDLVELAKKIISFLEIISHKYSEALSKKILSTNDIGMIQHHFSNYLKNGGIPEYEPIFNCLTKFA